MLRATVLSPSAATREVWWIHCARDRTHHPFAQESHALLRRVAKARSVTLYSRPLDTDRLGIDYDHPGRLNLTLIGELGLPREGNYYLCGPPTFLEQITRALREYGIPPPSIRAEVFASAAPRLTAVQSSATHPHPPAEGLGSGPRISFTRSGLTVCWSDRFNSLLELAEACEVPVRWSCRTGVCHNCESSIIDGTVHYSPEPIDRPAADRILICCATPDGDLQLEL